nr:MAG TPA: hypothetical protein [Caudoviricetes sp.]
MIKKITLLKIFAYTEMLFTLIAIGYVVENAINVNLPMAMLMLIVTAMGAYASKSLVDALNRERYKKGD